MHLMTKNARHRFIRIAPTACMALALTVVMTFGMVPVAPFVFDEGELGASQTAYAVTSAEKQKEVDAAAERLDGLQTELNQITVGYESAVAARAKAEKLMKKAQKREKAARKRIGELQDQLGVLAADMYRKGPASYLEVIFGAQSFGEFVSVVEMSSRINEHNADLISETKVVREEAEAARDEYAAQEKVLAQQEAEMKQLKVQQEDAVAKMQTEISALKKQAANLLAQEELAAEAARQRAAEDARRGSSGGGGASTATQVSVDPNLAARVPALTFPCPGYTAISSPFGPRWGGYHLGVDFAAPTGTPILSAAAGTVTASGYGSSMGNYLIVAHGGGVRTIYMHASALHVRAGASVAAGQQIASVGSTGNSTGPHLHFQLEVDGYAINPMHFL